MHVYQPRLLLSVFLLMISPANYCHGSTEGLPYDTSYKIPINRILVQTLYILLAIMSVVVGTYIYIKTFPRRKLDTAQPYSDLPFESEEHIECIELTEFPA